MNSAFVPDLKLIWTYKGKTYFEAMQSYYDYMGYEKFKITFISTTFLFGVINTLVALYHFFTSDFVVNYLSGDEKVIALLGYVFISYSLIIFWSLIQTSM